MFYRQKSLGYKNQFYYDKRTICHNLANADIYSKIWKIYARPQKVRMLKGPMLFSKYLKNDQTFVINFYQKLLFSFFKSV